MLLLVKRPHDRGARRVSFPVQDRVHGLGEGHYVPLGRQAAHRDAQGAVRPVARHAERLQHMARPQIARRTGRPALKPRTQASKRRTSVWLSRPSTSTCTMLGKNSSLPGRTSTVAATPGRRESSAYSRSRRARWRADSSSPDAQAAWQARREPCGAAHVLRSAAPRVLLSAAQQLRGKRRARPQVQRAHAPSGRPPCAQRRTPRPRRARPGRWASCRAPAWRRCGRARRPRGRSAPGRPRAGCSPPRCWPSAPRRAPCPRPRHPRARRPARTPERRAQGASRGSRHARARARVRAPPRAPRPS